MAKDAIIIQAQPFDLHGTTYYQLVFSYTDNLEVAHTARLGHESVYPNPQSGDQVIVESVINTVVEVKKKIG